MKQGWLAATVVTALLAGGATATAATTAEKASAVEPSEWLNYKGPAVSWGKLQGRLIVIEKWARW